MSAWATAALPWFQIFGTIFTAVAAIAAAFSAHAARRTAGKADETSRRALEGFGRATKPLLSIRLIDVLSRDPASPPMKLEIINHGPNRGWITQATVRRRDGPVSTTTMPMPVEIGSIVISFKPSYALVLTLGALPGLTTDSRADGDSDAVVTTEVEFTDTGKLVAWRQRERWQERTQIQADGLRTFSYELLDSSEPEIFNDLSRSESRPVGLVRRCWRWMW